MIRIILFIFISLNLAVSGTERFWVYFNDKDSPVSGSAEAYKSTLSDRALERRRSQQIDLDALDLPVNSKYIENLQKTGVTIHRKSRWFNAVSVYLNDISREQILALPYVNAIEPVLGFRGKKKPLAKSQTLTEIASTDYGGSQNQNSMLGVPEIHELGYSGENVRIALFDTGFLLKHEALQHVNVIDTYDFVQGDDNVANEPGDAPGQHNHGTTVLAVIGGYQPGKMIGPAYSAEYVLAKTEDISSETHVEEDNWVAAVEWADSLGVDIISSSLGYSVFDSGEGDYTYEDMDGETTIVTRGANIATRKGIAVFSSAGNEGNKKWQYITAPADGKDVIAMGGVMPDGEYWGVSSRGPTSDGRIKPDLAAQGQSVYTINPGTLDEYMTGSGTSLSCPLGAGTAALVLNLDPTLTASELRNLMKSSASQADSPDNFLGYGVIDLVKIAGVLKREHQVIITDFTISANEGNNALSWESKIEIDNKVWSILRSEEGGQPVEIYQLQGEEFSLSAKSYRYNDFDIKANKRYDYVLMTTSGNDETFLLDSLSVTSKIPDAVKILTNFPNPFNNTTVISFSLSKQSKVRLDIYDITGRRVNTLIDSRVLPADYYIVEWNGRNDSGTSVSSGSYFVALKSSNEITAHKILLLK